MKYKYVCLLCYTVFFIFGILVVSGWFYTKPIALLVTCAALVTPFVIGTLYSAFKVIHGGADEECHPIKWLKNRKRK